MTNRLDKIVSVNTSDRGGGAESVAWNLFKGFQRRGVESWLVVGDKKTQDPYVLPFFLSPYLDYRKYTDPQFQFELQNAKLQDTAQGIEDFHFPYTQYLPSITGSTPDLILCHNLHGGYFDLRMLAELSQQLPVCLVLHDCWPLTGHCAYPLGCPRWQTGCGQCPDLSLPPAIQQDASGFNWLRKASIYQSSRLYVVAPTRWLLERAGHSILAPAMLESRVIPCPVDTQRFCPNARAEARHTLGLSPDEHLLVYAAFQAKTNPYKDYATMEAALHRLAHLMPDINILFVALGEQALEQQVGKLRLRFLPFQSQAIVAKYLQAADVYVHAVQEDNSGLVTAEALACGTPVVATAVGGLPEVILDGQFGLLVPPRDAEAMAQTISRLLTNPALRQQLGDQAAGHARLYWDQERIVSLYLDWFEEILQTATISSGNTA